MILITALFLFFVLAALLSFLLGIAYLLKRKAEKSQIPVAIQWTFGISSALSLFLWFSAISPLIQRGRQVRTIGDMGVIVQCLKSYQERHGDFPARFTDAMPADLSNFRDGWSNPFHYEHSPGAFILVSFGSDAKPDIIDYWKLRETETKPGGDGRFTGDQVVSDRGWHRTLGR